jgi:hypothetical protein
LAVPCNTERTRLSRRVDVVAAWIGDFTDREW